MSQSTIGYTKEEVLGLNIREMHFKHKWPGGWGACFFCISVKKDPRCYFRLNELVVINNLLACKLHIEEVSRLAKS